MNELDDKIREALRKEDAELFADFGGEPSMHEMVMETYRGKHRWFAMLATFWSFGFTVIFILAAVKFFRVEATRDLLLWAAVCIICVSGACMTKIWYFMEFNKNAVTREVKRLELQIARLAGRIKESCKE